MARLLSPRILLLVAILCSGGAWSDNAAAQMFAPRSNYQAVSGNFPGASGTSLTNSGSSANSSKGAIMPNSRFVRTGRAPDDFVGTDLGDRRRYVGVRQSATRTPRTPVLLPQRPERNVNQAAPTESSSATSLYPPRIVLDTELSEIRPVAVGAVLQRRLEGSRALHLSGPLEVSIEGRTAILRGTVASTKERALAGLLAELEPGISNVQNDLQVRLAPEPLETPVPAPR